MSKLVGLLGRSRLVSGPTVKVVQVYQPDATYVVEFEYDYSLGTITEWVTRYFEYHLSQQRVLEAQGRINVIMHKLRSTRQKNDQKALLKAIKDELEQLNLQKYTEAQAHFKTQSDLLLSQYAELGPYQRNLERERRFRIALEAVKAELTHKQLQESERNRLELQLCQIKAKHYTLSPVERARIQIIMSYIELAQEYIKLKIIRTLRVYPECSICHYAVLPHSVTDEGFQVCVMCGNREYKPGARYDPIRSDAPVIEKSDEANIMKAFERRACLQSVALPDDMEEQLDEYLKEHKLPIAAKLRELPLIKRYRGSVNHKTLWKALEAKGFNKYYKHADLIGVRLWGWSKPQMEYLRDDFIAIYRKTQASFNSIEDKTRKSSISTQLRLYYQLELLGHDCQIGEFKIPTGAAGLSDQEKLWEQMCQMTQDPFIVYHSLK